MRNFFIYILFLYNLSSYAQEIDSLSVSAYEVIEKINVTYEGNVDSLLQSGNLETDQKLYSISFQEGFQEKYIGEDFDYTKTKPRLSFRERIYRIIRKIFSFILPSKGIRNIERYTQMALIFISAIIILIVGYFVVKILRNKQGNWFLSKKNNTVLPEETELVEDIHEINFSEIILQYEQKGNYRLAIRYQFLSVLKTLTDQQKIQWHQQKTNSDYIKELKKPQEKEAFKQIAYIFDYVWYGEFPISEEKYKSVLPKFELIKNRGYE